MLDFLSRQISSNPAVILRRARQDDFHFINEISYSEMNEIVNTAWRNKFNWESWYNDVEEAAKGAFHKVFIIMVQDISVGYLWLNVEISGNLWITAIVLQTEWQQRNIGERIMLYLIDECRKNQLKSIELGVQNNNERALKFYRKLGFKQFDHLKEANTNLLRLDLDVE
jgi:GNAT superfamily N-acetyltransferase